MIETRRKNMRISVIVIAIVADLEERENWAVVSWIETRNAHQDG